MTFDEGVIAERNRIITLLDEYEIIEMLGGGYMLKPRWEKPDKSWKGITHRTGSLSSYYRQGCRCDTCKAFVSAYQKHRRTIRKGN